MLGRPGPEPRAPLPDTSTTSSKNKPYVTAPSGLPLLVAKGSSAAALSVGAVLTARGLVPSERGILALYLTVGTLSSLIGTLGIGTAARIRLVSRQDDGTPRLSLSEFTGASLVLVALQL